MDFSKSIEQNTDSKEQLKPGHTSKNEEASQIS